MLLAAAAPVQGSPTGQISVGLILVLAVIIAVMVFRHRQARRRTPASGPVHRHAPTRRSSDGRG